MSNHTPGPWKIFDDHPDPDLLCLHVCHGDEQIADVSELKNAHLIAAAPELLEALECYVEKVADLNRYGVMIETSLRKKAEAAIAKAKGE